MVQSRYLADARPIQDADLAWLEPMAERYGELQAMRHALQSLVIGWVVPEKALVCIYRTPEGLRGAGLTTPQGIRYCIALGKLLMRGVLRMGVLPIYAKVDSGDTWQPRFFQQLGFVPDGDRLWFRGV